MGLTILNPMTKDEAIEHFGSQTELGKVLALDQSTISKWKAVPLDHQMYLEKLTLGKLKADPHPAEQRA